MLEELVILNGKLDLKFDKYNYIYTVSVSNNIESLNINYKVSDGYQVNIIDNILDKEENYVYLKVFNNDEINTYTLIVNKESEYTTSLIEDYKRSLEVNKEEFDPSKIILIGVTCFIILLIIFILLFMRKKKA